MIITYNDTKKDLPVEQLHHFPEYQNKGIGKELVKRCIEHFPNCEC